MIDIVKFDNVALRYGLGPEVLLEVSLAIKRKSFQFIIGSTGCGKSSLVRLMYCLAKPFKGVVTLFNHNIAKLPYDELIILRRKIGVVFQESQLLDHMTVFDNVALPLRIAGIEESSYSGDVFDMLSWIGLGDYIHNYPTSLSYGERHLVAVARSIIIRPELLIIDELSGSIDLSATSRIIRLLAELNKAGTTVIIMASNDNIAQHYNYKKIAMENGRLVNNGK